MNSIWIVKIPPDYSLGQVGSLSLWFKLNTQAYFGYLNLKPTLLEFHVGFKIQAKQVKPKL